MNHILPVRKSLLPRQIGWLMMFSVFVDSWFLFSVPMTLTEIRTTFHPTSFYIGLIAASVNVGALAGSMVGGRITDIIGRKSSLTISVLIFIAAAIGESLSSSPSELALFRAMAGFPIGSDLVTGYAYIMDVMERGDRDKMGARNTLMASIAIVSINSVALFGMILHVPSAITWRLVMILPIFPLVLIAVLRRRLPESEAFLEARRNLVASLPDGKRNAGERTNDWRGLLNFIHSERTISRTCFFCWISIAVGSIEIGTFAYFIPTTVSFLNVSSPLLTEIIVILVFSVGIVAGYVGPEILPKRGFRFLSGFGYAMTLVSLAGTGAAIYTSHPIFVPVFMAIFVWGNHWNQEVPLAVQSIISRPEFRGTLLGITNFAGYVPSFLTILVFPTLFTAIGLGLSNILISLAPLAGLIATILLLKETYMYAGDKRRTSA